MSRPVTEARDKIVGAVLHGQARRVNPSARRMRNSRRPAAGASMAPGLGERMTRRLGATRGAQGPRS